MPKFKSNGKLLLTGEYVVLDGANALAVPTKLGQSLSVEAIDISKIYWKSFDNLNNLWYEGEFEIVEGILRATEQNDVSNRIVQIFNAVNTLNGSFLRGNRGFNIETSLDFPTNWGLGTSSTLINNIAQWANVDAFKLLELTFGGSGYDIACAQHNMPITYNIKNGAPEVKQVNFQPSFKDQLYFVYLNKKQNSREGIAHYKAQDKKDLEHTISEINRITSKMINCEHLESFQKLVEEHEQLISSVTKQETVKRVFFPDFKGSIKSLGAWGGDFILVASKDNPRAYFEQKGFNTIVSYKDMLL
ncbi:GYDIA family GHMP kinase [Seonamhaeicola marinus]|uniref:GHMP kinase n=1 Tax=Seonamhaeicola marinus TaxID=1912246 RepID=A0A5D0J828_9FLAO|nr:GYDIA family GHMP kinase [Seonamhaeicola marinus]TYA92353.1 GHMP kinase [Seonamhaeicola marinus]